MRPQILVIGVGNFLLSDEGFGIHVIRSFQERYRIPPEVEVVDGGCLGFSLSDYLRDKNLVLMVDVIADKASPGSYRVLSVEELLSWPALEINSCHQVSLVEAIKFAEFAGLKPPKWKILAAVPERLSSGIELSPALQDLVPKAVEWLAEEISREGIKIEKKPCV